MTTLLIIVHVFVCFFLIAVVLLQSGRAGGMGVLSGAATQTVFGGRGAGGFLQKTTAIAAIVFMITCASLSWIASSTRDRGLRTPEPTSTPAGRAPERARGNAASGPASGTSAPSTAPTPGPTPAPTPAESPTPPAPPGTTAPAPTEAPAHPAAPAPPEPAAPTH